MLGKAVPDTRAIVMVPDEADEASLLRCRSATSTHAVALHTITDVGVGGAPWTSSPGLDVGLWDNASLCGASDC
jgi:hypothetical protein